MVRNRGAAQALRALALDVKTPEREETNAGSEASSLGARLMGFMRSPAGRRASAVAAFGISLLGVGQTVARADTIFIEQGNHAQLTQAARELATQVGEEFVLVRPSHDALKVVFQDAHKGKVDMRHLILSSDGGGVDVDMLRQLKQQYPQAFEQVEQVHVIGEDPGGDPFKGEGKALFPNAKSIVSFQMVAQSANGPASAWLLKDSTTRADSIQPGMTPTQALLHARGITSAGRDQGAHVRVQVGDQLATDLTSAPADATQVAIDKPLPLTAAVGEGKPNHKDDVRAVQQRLKDLGFPIGVDGAFGGQTDRYIEVLETMLTGREYVTQSASASIEPGGPLHRALQSDDCPRWGEMPSEGPGYKNLDWDAHDFGTTTLVRVIQRTGQRYFDDYLKDHPNAAPIATNDASKKKAGLTNDHETHQAGLDLDIRLPRKSGETGSDVRWANYDRDATRAILKALVADPGVERILFSDPVLLQEFNNDKDPNCRKLQDGGRIHRNHIHVDVAPPEIS
jgi:hypothetical protein